MIRAVIFDLWDTLAYNKNHIGSYIEKINQEIGIENKNKFTKLRREWYLFNITSEEFFTKLLKDVNKPLAMLEHLTKIWDSQIEVVELYPETIDVLETLKIKGIKLILISNTTPISEKAIDKLKIRKYFDYVLLSCNEGIVKPSPFVYKKILDKFNLKPGEVIAVGDQMSTDIEGASTYGIKAILLDREDKGDYKNKITELDEVEFYLK